MDFSKTSVTALLKAVRVTQSPMNAKQWCVDLECGHEIWVTSNRKPKKQSYPCEKCSEFWSKGKSLT